MGLYVRLNILPERIDEERWEAVWLTGMQLLERFPGPLAARRFDDNHQERFSNSPRILFDAGTPEERWRIEGDLASNRFAETYALWRHLAHYRERARRRSKPGAEASRDVLWVPDDEHAGSIAGQEVFDAKSQGYPFHYAMLAIGMLVEDAFPDASVVSGDISRMQAERTGPWMESILGRPVRMPVVTDGERLLRRLTKAYDGQIGPAIVRCRYLYREDSDSTWRFLLRMEDEPAAEFLYEEIARQMRRPPGMKEFAREVGKKLREGLTSNANPRFRKDLDAFGRRELIEQISLASRKHGFALRESAWEQFDRATTDELRHLTMLALMKYDEIRFWESRLCLLESPELRRLLAGEEPTDPT